MQLNLVIISKRQICPTSSEREASVLVQTLDIISAYKKED